MEVLNFWIMSVSEVVSITNVTEHTFNKALRSIPAVVEAGADCIGIQIEDDINAGSYII